MNTNHTICVVGLGYVGLPLAVELAKYFKVYGFDINEQRIATLIAGSDPNREVDSELLASAALEFSFDPVVIGNADFVIVAVPTPVDSHNNGR